MACKNVIADTGLEEDALPIRCKSAPVRGISDHTCCYGNQCASHIGRFGEGHITQAVGARLAEYVKRCISHSVCRRTHHAAIIHDDQIGGVEVIRTVIVELDETAKIDDGTGTTVSDLTGAQGLNREHVAFQDLTGFPANSDVLISGTDGASGTEDTINGSAVGFGVGTGQRIGEDDTIRFDFVTDLVRTGSPLGTEFTIDTHYSVTGFTFSVSQLTGTGSQPNLATLMIRVYGDVDDDDWLAANGWLTDEGPSATDLISALLVNGDTPLSQGITATPFVGDATYGTGFILEGVEMLDQFAIFSVGGFERIEITNFSNGVLGGTTFGSNHKDFDVGNIGFTQIVAGSEVDLAYEVQLEDGDGDTTTAQLDINLQPEPASGTSINIAGDANSEAEVFAADLDFELIIADFGNEDFIDLSEVFDDYVSNGGTNNAATFISSNVEINASGELEVDSDTVAGVDTQVATLTDSLSSPITDVTIIVDDNQGDVMVS